MPAVEDVVDIDEELRAAQPGVEMLGEAQVEIRPISPCDVLLEFGEVTPASTPDVLLAVAPLA